MTSVGRVHLFSALLFLCVGASVTVSPCRTTARLLQDGRIELCACEPTLVRSKWTVSQRDCRLPIVYFDFDRTIDRCLLSEALDLSRYAGKELVVCPPWNTSIPLDYDSSSKRRRERSDERPLIETPTPDVRPAVITGFRVEDVDKGVSYDEDGASVILAGAHVTARLFGFGFTNDSEFRFVMGDRERGANCDNLPFIMNVQINKDSLTTYSTLVSFRLPSLDQIGSGLDDADPANGDVVTGFSVCSLGQRHGHTYWIHQGDEPGVRVKTYERTLPFWLQVVIIAVLMTLSGLFSGLNLGLMALDRTELKIYENTGTDEEKRHAKAISPVRNHGNYLLCTLLLGNVLVNSTLTILLDDLTSGIIAIAGSTIGIVIFGEIIPQAICSRHGLAIGAYTVWITKFFMLVTFPLSYPISLLLDRILGKELGAFYNRERLKELITVTKEFHDLEKDEVNIIAGALEMRRKTVGDIMTRLEDVFMLSDDSVLDFETVSQIMKQGFSRVPIFEDDRNNIVGLLFIKELALVDPEDAIPVKTLCRFYQNKCNFVFEDTTLDIMFKEFKEGHKGHMAFIQRINCQGDGDPFYETIGLVTLEDIIEELIQAEIIDETDVWVDNRSKRHREKGRLLQDFGAFAFQQHDEMTHKISPQLALAAFQFLSSSVEPFRFEYVSESVLRRLMRHHHVIRSLRIKNADKSDTDSAAIIYQQNKPADYFVLILEGRVEVTVGRECLVFESGPFSYFGLQALTGVTAGSNLVESPSAIRLSHSVQSVQTTTSPDMGMFGSALASGTAVAGGTRSQTFITDYTVRATTDVTYIRLNRSLYQAAVTATSLERARDADQRPSFDGDLSLQSSFDFLSAEENCRILDEAKETSPLMMQDANNLHAAIYDNSTSASNQDDGGLKMNCPNGLLVTTEG